MKKKFKPLSPWGPQWRYITTTMRSVDGVMLQHQLWQNKKTGKVEWYKL